MLDVVNANINIYRLNIDSFLTTIKFPDHSIPNLGELSPEEAAQTIRKKWKITKGAIDNLTEILEENGVIITSFDFETERVDSRSILTDSKHPLIFTNKTMPGDRLRFSLAYELGHLLMHAYNKPNFDIDAGHKANLFAAELLMPSKDIAAEFKHGVTLQTLAELKTKWKVSMQALLYRAADLELITANQKRYLLSQFNDMGIRRREPLELDIAKEHPRLLRDLITKYRTRQKMSVKDMAAYFHLNEQEFEKRYTMM
jgi:Zn-dependent peptidase ImmA (M78 family)